MHRTRQGDRTPTKSTVSPSREAHHIQRKQKIEAARQRQQQFYEDEHPEVPKVRRASRQTTPEQTPRSSSSRAGGRRVTHPSRRNPSSSFRETSHHTRVTTARFPDMPVHEIPREHGVEKQREASWYGEDEAPSALDTRNPVMLSKPRRPRVYEPPSTPRGRRGGRPVRPAKQPYAPFLTRLYVISRNRPFLIVSTILVLSLILLPLAVNIVSSNLNRAGSTIIITDPRTWGGNASNTTGQQNSDANRAATAPLNYGHPAPPVFATSAYLLDADSGTTLYAHNAFEHLPMLSTTKLMTALLAAEEGNPDQSITITPAIANDINQLSADSSLMGVKKGETYTMRDLLYGMFLASGNDAAIAVADGVSGSLPAFVARMNQRAAQLGMHDTHYMNPHGLLEPGHYSSAHDLAVIGRASLSIPLLRAISGTKQYHIPATSQHAEHFLVNGNQFLWWYPGVDSGKPGWDGNTDFIQVVSCVRNHHHLIGVTMNTRDWWTDMRDLMNWGFGTFQWISPATVDATQAIPYDSDWDYFVKDKKENTIPTSDHGRYYVYTGFSVSGMILTYFNKSGGLQKFGFPIGMPGPMAHNMIAQKFEHATIACTPATGQCAAA